MRTLDLRPPRLEFPISFELQESCGITCKVTRWSHFLNAGMLRESSARERKFLRENAAVFSPGDDIS